MSGTAISVWSKLVEPGQDTLITEDVSIQITQIALELPETLVADNAAKRSILKMQFLEAEPALLSAAAGLDQEDSDFEGDSDEDSEEDDEEIDSDEAGVDASMADLSKISKASTSSKKSNGKAAAAAAAEEEDDDEDSEDEEDSEFEFDRQEAEVQIASLIPGRIEHINTNIVLVGGDDYVLKLSGDYKVHLLGNYIVQPIPEQFQRGGANGSEYDSELESDFDEDEDMYDDLEDEEEEDAARFVELEEKKQPAAKKDKAAAPASAPTAAAAVAEADTSKLSKNQKKKLAKEQAQKGAAPEPAAKPAAEKKEAAPAAAPAEKKEAAAKKAPSKRTTLPNGLIIEEGKAGTGPVAKAGQRVSMRYIGRLNNGKIFDQNTKGAAFSFKLGKGEVIKGWDTGVPGMQAGGERKLIIPPALAYGKQAISGIPANSTLTFEIKLLSIK